MGPVTRSKTMTPLPSAGPAVPHGVDLFDSVFAIPLDEAEAELEEEAAAGGAQAPEEEEREVFAVRTAKEEARASARGRGRPRGRPRGSGRGRGSSRKGTQGARDVPAEERLPYGFPAEGERNQPLAPVEDLVRRQPR